MTANETRYDELLRHVRAMRHLQHSYFCSVRCGRPDQQLLAKAKRAERLVDQLISGQRNLLEEKE